MKRRLVYLLAVVAVIAVGVFWLSREDAVAVALAEVERGTVEYTVANTRAGTIKACRRAELAPAAGGQVATMPVREGEKVEKGQVLLELWNEDLEAQLEVARAEVRAAEANVEQSCVRAEAARREANRLQALEERKLVAEEAVDQAVTEANAQEAACRAARSQLNVARESVRAAQAALERTILRAPFAGRVAEINTEVGEYVTPSPPGIPTPPAVDLVDTSCLYVQAPIDEVDAPAIQTGMPARITLDAFPDVEFKGEVRRIAPYVSEVEQQARTVDVEAVFTAPEQYQQLLPGYSADLEVIIEVREGVLLIPTEAVLPGQRVLVYDPESGRIEERRIETGLSNWRVTQVVSGLSAGEQVVTSVDREGVEPGVPAEPE